MAETKASSSSSLQQTPDQKSHTFINVNQNLLHLQLTTDSYFMERGSRYKTYALLRESKLRLRRLEFDEDPHHRQSKIPRSSEITPVKMMKMKKSVSFQDSQIEIPSSGVKKQRGSSVSVVAQSVPDFSAALRKENRKPGMENRVPRAGKAVTTPPSVSKKMYGSSGEKQSRLVMNGRKSCVSMDELKGLSIAASSAINGENRGGGGGGGGRRVNVLRKSSVFSTRYGL